MAGLILEICWEELFPFPGKTCAEWIRKGQLSTRELRERRENGERKRIDDEPDLSIITALSFSDLSLCYFHGCNRVVAREILQL